MNASRNVVVVCRLALVAMFAIWNMGCGRSGDATAASERVVLYSSVDAEFLRAAVAELERTTGLDIDVVTDTEATKTFGLVQRVLSERDRPRADVWWSSEPFGTMRLAQAGVLAPWSSELEDEPAEWINASRGVTWRGFAARGRVLVYASDRLDVADVPTTLGELTDPRWRGRVAIARPQFGTTRGHMAALLDRWGPEAFEAWLVALRDNGARVYDSNSTVVREVALGAVDLALTDTDDVYASQVAGRDVDLVHVGSGLVGEHGTAGEAGPVVLPNTVAMIANAPNPEAAQVLARAIRSPEIERLLARSASRNTPLHTTAAAEFPALAIPDPLVVNLEAVFAAEGEALAIVHRVFGG